MTRCEGLCKRETFGYAWFQDDGDWKRYIIHRCPDCGRRDPERIHRLDLEKPFCFDCFNQDLDMAEDSDGVQWFTCLKCDKIFMDTLE